MQSRQPGEHGGCAGLRQLAREQTLGVDVARWGQKACEDTAGSCLLLSSLGKEAGVDADHCDHQPGAAALAGAREETTGE